MSSEREPGGCARDPGAQILPGNSTSSSSCSFAQCSASASVVGSGHRDCSPGLEVRSCLLRCAQYRRRVGQLVASLYRALVTAAGEPHGTPHSRPVPAVFDLSVLFKTIA